MQEYELYPRATVPHPYAARFHILEHAIKAAKELSAKYHVDVAVVRVVGIVVNETRWVDNGWEPSHSVVGSIGDALLRATRIVETEQK